MNKNSIVRETSYVLSMVISQPSNAHESPGKEWEYGEMGRWRLRGLQHPPCELSTTGRHPRFISSCLHAPLPHAGTRTEELILVCVTM